MGEMPFNPKTAVRRLGDVPRQGPEHPFPKIRLVPEGIRSRGAEYPSSAEEARKVARLRSEIETAVKPQLMPKKEENGILDDFMKSQRYASQVQAAINTPTELEPSEYAGYALTYLKNVGQMSLRMGVGVGGTGVVDFLIPWEDFPVVGPYAGAVKAVLPALIFLGSYTAFTKKPLQKLGMLFGIGTGSIKLGAETEKLHKLYPEMPQQELQVMAALEVNLSKNNRAQERIKEIQEQNPDMTRVDAIQTLMREEYAKANEKELDELRKRHPDLTEQELVIANETSKFMEANHKRIVDLRKKFPQLSNDQILTLIQIDQVRESKKNAPTQIMLKYMIQSLGVAAATGLVLHLLPALVAGSGALLTGIFATLAINFGRRFLIYLLNARTTTRMQWRQKKWMGKDGQLTPEAQDEIKSMIDEMVLAEE